MFQSPQINTSLVLLGPSSVKFTQRRVFWVAAALKDFENDFSKGNPLLYRFAVTHCSHHVRQFSVLLTHIFDQRMYAGGNRAERRGVNMFYSKQPHCLSENILSHITLCLYRPSDNCIHVESHVLSSFLSSQQVMNAVLVLLFLIYLCQQFIPTKYF